MTSLTTQVGGSHYSTMKIQPVEFITSNKLTFLEGNVIKYLCRHRAKGGKQDLEKAAHYLQMLIEADYPEVKGEKFLPGDLIVVNADHFGYGLKNGKILGSRIGNDGAVEYGIFLYDGTYIFLREDSISARIDATTGLKMKETVTCP